MIVDKRERHTRMRAARNAAVCAAVMYLCAMVSDTIVMRASGSALLQGEDRNLAISHSDTQIGANQYYTC